MSGILSRRSRCEQHEINNLPYLAFHEDAEIRTKRGERQYKCAECGLWQWPRPATQRDSAPPRDEVRDSANSADIGGGDGS